MADSRKRKYYKVFANEERVRLLVCLATPKDVTGLMNTCTLSQSALSQHLKVLRDAGLVCTKREGRHITYSVLNKEILSVAQSVLDIARNM